MLRVAVVGGGPSGSCAAEVLAKAGIQTWLFERKLDNAKPCGGAIPLCMVDEFDLPASIIDRKVRNMKMISPSNREVDIHLGDENEYIGMCRREVMDGFLRDRAAGLGAQLINGLVQSIDTGVKRQGPYTLQYADYSAGGPTGEIRTLEVDLIVGADGANSRVAKAMDAGDYNVAIAFQERIRLPKEEMSYYEDLAEMYVGTDVSPDFYGWVFPKYDHVAVGTGTMQQNQSLIKSLQKGIRSRASARLLDGEVIKVEAHPIPEHPRPRRVVGRMALVGDAAGYVTKSSGEGIYFAAKSGRMCAEQIVAASDGGRTIPTEKDLKVYIKKWDRKYGATYKVLEILQNIFYRNDAAREAFVEMCDDKDVQRLTFDSYLYKRVVMMNPWQQIKLTLLTFASILRGQALAPQSYQPVASAVRSPEEMEARRLARLHPTVAEPVVSADSEPAAESKPAAASVALDGGARQPALASKS
ncbi:geranylgeranyl reductase [Synechococcus sp. Tobar12-5m-g]|uniref:geranylgeranyl reductase n=1 Tax=unclassified Synechococcus TaxID=2626047 RepID=UPI0020CBCAE6|nr:MULTISPECIES: geranylgeranyl reductase [unclassified Synechococcus]MCP9772203.1 geranylgeranyl reductase [Synechococcus sp. Tobar12-5m-g]MCP9873126.1 geranylgeranyl reductase [Synechococcus sp. Cruz CV-v-12]